MTLENLNLSKLFKNIVLCLITLIFFLGCGNKNADNAAKEVSEMINTKYQGSNFKVNISPEYIKNEFGLYNSKDSSGEQILNYNNNKIQAFAISFILTSSLVSLSNWMYFSNIELNDSTLAGGNSTVNRVHENLLKQQGVTESEFKDANNAKIQTLVNDITSILDEKVNTQVANSGTTSVGNTMAGASGIETNLSPDS